jgi:hypothetical protein
MTAGIFAEHGVWTGEYRKGDAINAKGHFENLHFKKLVRKYRKTGIHKPNRPFKPDSEFLKEFLEINPVEPWLIKGSAMYWPLFNELNPKYICVRRDKNETMHSCKRVGLYFDGMEESFDRHMRELDKLKNGVDVNTDEVIAGDYSSLENAFSMCELELDKSKVDKFVDRKLWHCGS